MGNVEILATFVIILNLLMWWSNIAMMDINPDGTSCFNLEGTIVANSVASSGGSTVLNTSITTDLPSGQSTVSTSSGTNIFTDTFTSIIGWFKSAPGLKYLYAILTSPFNTLSCMGLPSELTAGLGVLWYVISILVVLSFLWGR